MNRNNIIIVVLYKKQLYDSDTIKSLLNIDGNLFKLIVVNNGPEILKTSNADYLDLLENINLKGFDFNLYEYTNNKPLSFLYNDIINEHLDYETYTIFDDDTIFDENYFSLVFQGDDSYDIILPDIISITDKKKYYPILNNSIIHGDVLSYNLVKSDNLFSISSGMIISHKLVNKFSSKNRLVFNESFALYGVDFSLFRGMKLLKNKFGINFNIKFNSEVLHSLSRLDKRENESRQTERFIDIFLSRTLYPDGIIRLFLFYAKCFYTSLVDANFKKIKLIIFLLVNKKHPRCKSFKEHK